MNRTERDLIELVRIVVCQHKEHLLSIADWDNLFELACKNHLESVLYYAICGENRNLIGEIPDAIMIKVKNKHLRMVYRDTNQIYYLSQIERVLKEAKIPYALQKGSILRYDYPVTDMRFMADTDIYINPKDRGVIKKCMDEIGGVLKGTESGDDQYLFSGEFGIEFHGRLLYRMNKNGAIENYPAWEFINEESNRLTEEGFALNLIGHAVRNLAHGGLGVRYILDLWIYRHRHTPQPNWDVVWKRLKEDKIDKAANNLLELSEFLFGETNRFSENSCDVEPVVIELADYVLEDGLYGDRNKGYATKIARSGGKGKLIIKQIFRDRVEFENRYPWLKKYAFLLPVAWIMRIVNTIKNNWGFAIRWFKGVTKSNSSEIRSQKERMKRWGL